MKRVLVTGAGGLVGSRILAQLSGKLELVSLPRGILASAGEDQVMELVAQTVPQVILHTAAISDTGYCQAHPQESYRANVLLPLWLARAARAAGAGMVAFSSDQVYAGLSGEGPFSETTPLSPGNTYGTHKLEGEERVLDLLPQAVFLRATWMYYLSGYQLPIRGNLPLNLLDSALSGKPLTFSSRDKRGVTYLRQVVENLLPALDWPGGVYNFGSETSLDSLATARLFARILGISPVLEEARWERCLSMDCSKARAGGALFDPPGQGLVRCLKDHGLTPAWEL